MSGRSPPSLHSAYNIVLATEETTVTQQVSHRPIKCKSRSWSQRGTEVMCMYVCLVITYSKRRINRVRLPILFVVSWRGKMNISLSPFAPETLVSRDGFGSPVLRRPAHLHTQAESGAYLRDSSRFPFYPITAQQKKHHFCTSTSLGHHPTEGGCAGGD